MRKYFVFILSVLLVFSLIGCGQEQSDSQGSDGNHSASNYNSANRNEPNNNNNSSNSESAGRLKMLCNETSFNNHFGTDSGFYYFSQYDKIGKDLSGRHLMYIDYATKKEVYLCSSSSCQHNTESCTSVFSDMEFGTGCLVFASKNYLYVLNRDYDMDGSSSTMLGSGTSSLHIEEQFAELYRMGFDGSGRQKIFSFPQNTTLENIVFGDGEDFWFIAKNLSFDVENNTEYTTSTNRSLVKYDVSENKTTDTISLSFNDNMYYEVIGVDGSHFVLVAIEYPNGMTQYEAERLSGEEWKNLFYKSSSIYETLDINSHEKNEIYRFSNNSGLAPAYAIIDGTIFFSDYENGGIIKVDLSSGDKSKLSDTAPNGIVYFLKDSICSFGDKDDNSLYFTDIETGETYQSTLTNKSTGFRIEILADTVDQVLVIYDYICESNGDSSFSVDGRCYAMIDKADLYASKANYQTIKMAGDGM